MRGPITFIDPGTSGLFAHRFFYRKIDFRAPKKGEWYLSGAIVQAYKAPNDLTTPYVIVEKSARAMRKTVEVAVPL